MQNVTDRVRNPFGMEPGCERYVPGYGDVNADFHIIGDHPGVHGGLDAGIPFTGETWSAAFIDALVESGLLVRDGGDFGNKNGEANVPDDLAYGVGPTYLSYLHMCAVAGEPTAEEYDDMERFLDAEVRAIAAHVLLPVGDRATDHVLRSYTARAWKTELNMEALHAEELLGAGWLVLPIKEPAEWVDGDADRLVEALEALQATDFRRESDLGRFIAGSDPYFVR